MVETQIWQRGIKDKRVLDALLTVPRHRFVPPELVENAYADHPLSIGYNQTISQPYIVAYMTEIAQISPNATLLEIGTGSGYQAAVLGELAKTVYSIERISALAEQASKTLHQLGYTNVHIKIGDGYQGWIEHAPYDVIIVTAAPVHVPENLINQLAMHGRLVIPVGYWDQQIKVITKLPERNLLETTIPVQFVAMVRGILPNLSPHSGWYSNRQSG
jgi:protein-L-isoaspartate(D-aspartate) O-methyltransferase